MSADLAAMATGGGLTSGAASAAVQLDKATLSEAPSIGASSLSPSGIQQAANAGPLEFDFNPEKISISHSQKFTDLAAGDRETAIANLGDTEITIDKITFTGPLTQLKCNRLLDWSFSPTGAVPDGDTTAKAVKLFFRWGTAFDLGVYIRQVSITYLRFFPNGTPNRAEVRLQMFQPNSSPIPGQNPTSGGPPGRSTRMLDSSGCLASLAYATYDRPGAWRLVARANGIDDPLRVRPGTVLYLPQRAEPERETGASR